MGNALTVVLLSRLIQMFVHTAVVDSKRKNQNVTGLKRQKSKLGVLTFKKRGSDL